jgi:hypothetical protein
MNNYIEFKPKYSAKFQAKHLDHLDFQWSGTDEDGEFIMYCDIAEVIEENGEMFIAWNGRKYPAYHFLHCDHLDGDISMSSVSVYRGSVKVS